MLSLLLVLVTIPDSGRTDHGASSSTGSATPEEILCRAPLSRPSSASRTRNHEKSLGGGSIMSTRRSSVAPAPVHICGLSSTRSVSSRSPPNCILHDVGSPGGLHSARYRWSRKEELACDGCSYATARDFMRLSTKQYITHTLLWSAGRRDACHFQDLETRRTVPSLRSSTHL
jgi:hypothetical protein